METIVRKGQRPGPEGAMRYYPVALTANEATNLDDWAWRLRISRAQLLRYLVRDGLRKYEDTLPEERRSEPPAPLPIPGLGG